MTLPDPANAKFKIDDAQVTGFERQDTKHGLISQGLTSRRIEYIPGTRVPFVLKGRQRLPMLYVTGFLRAASFDALQAMIRTHENWIDQTTTCKVTIYGTDYDPIAPIDFKALKKTPLSFTDADQVTPGARLPVLFLFQTLS